MSILSSSKPCGFLQFTLKNGTFKFSVYNNYYCHDTGRSFEPIFRKFTWLVGAHRWVNPKLVFLAFIQSIWGFWGKNFKVMFGTPFPTEKVIFIFVVWHPISWKMVMTPKIIFCGYFVKYCFFFFKLFYKKYSELHFLQKSLYWFLSPDNSFPAKWSCLSINGFSQFFQHKLKNICKVFLLESILVWKKILWRINFVLIKFLPNALLFDKLQNECKNLLLLHITCVPSSDPAEAVSKFHIHGFVL